MRKNFLILVLGLFLSPLIGAETVHLLAVGDTGKNGPPQKQVAEAMLRHCQIYPCQYGLLLGDNLYNEGMKTPNDPKMDEVFKNYYSRLPIPFFVTLGNHDYGALSNNWTRGSYQLGYSKSNPQFMLPNYWYYVEFENFVLAVIDTTRMMWSKDLDLQRQMLQEAHNKSKGKFFIVMGHHPYLSNGSHGNAGRYEGVSRPSFVSGTEVKKMIDQEVCGKAHLYLSGHDHSLQLASGAQAGCSTLLVVSGAGGDSDGLEKRNSTIFEAQSLGFVTLAVDATQISLKFWNQDNQLLYQGRTESPLKFRRSRRR